MVPALHHGRSMTSVCLNFSIQPSRMSSRYAKWFITFYICNIYISTPNCLSVLKLLHHCVPSLINLVYSWRQKLTMQQIFFTVTCCDTKAHILGRIIAPRHDFLPSGSFVMISNGFVPQLVQQRYHMYLDLKQTCEKEPHAIFEIKLARECQGTNEKKEKAECKFSKSKLAESYQLAIGMPIEPISWCHSHFRGWGNSQACPPVMMVQ